MTSTRAAGCASVNRRSVRTGTTWSSAPEKCVCAMDASCGTSSSGFRDSASGDTSMAVVHASVDNTTKVLSRRRSARRLRARANSVFHNICKRRKEGLLVALDPRQQPIRDLVAVQVLHQHVRGAAHAHIVEHYVLHFAAGFVGCYFEFTAQFQTRRPAR